MRRLVKAQDGDSRRQRDETCGKTLSREQSLPMSDRNNGDERRQTHGQQTVSKEQNACKCALGGSANPMRRRERNEIEALHMRPLQHCKNIPRHTRGKAERRAPPPLQVVLSGLPADAVAELTKMTDAMTEGLKKNTFKTPEDAEKFRTSWDWNAITEQDGELWDKIFDFIEGGSKK